MRWTVFGFSFALMLGHAVAFARIARADDATPEVVRCTDENPDACAPPKQWADAGFIAVTLGGTLLDLNALNERLAKAGYDPLARPVAEGGIEVGIRKGPLLIDLGLSAPIQFDLSQRTGVTGAGVALGAGFALRYRRFTFYPLVALAYSGVDAHSTLKKDPTPADTPTVVASTNTVALTPGLGFDYLFGKRNSAISPLLVFGFRAGYAIPLTKWEPNDPTNPVALSHAPPAPISGLTFRLIVGLGALP